jgi:hypothetical protein
MHQGALPLMKNRWRWTGGVCLLITGQILFVTYAYYDRPCMNLLVWAWRTIPFLALAALRVASAILLM